MSSTAPVATRLLNGAKMLGSLWNSQIRCPRGWQECQCEESERTKFCKAKRQWLALGLEHREPHIRYVNPESPIYLLECMTTAELDLTGVTVTVEIPEIGRIKVGAKGEITWKALYETGPETLKAVMMILRQFPGSKLAG